MYSKLYKIMLVPSIPGHWTNKKYSPHDWNSGGHKLVTNYYTKKEGSRHWKIDKYKRFKQYFNDIDQNGHNRIREWTLAGWPIQHRTTYGVKIK